MRTLFRLHAAPNRLSSPAFWRPNLSATKLAIGSRRDSDSSTCALDLRRDVSLLWTTWPHRVAFANAMRSPEFRQHRLRLAADQSSPVRSAALRSQRYNPLVGRRGGGRIGQPVADGYATLAIGLSITIFPGPACLAGTRQLSYGPIMQTATGHEYSFHPPGASHLARHADRVSAVIPSSSQRADARVALAHARQNEPRLRGRHFRLAPLIRPRARADARPALVRWGWARAQTRRVRRRCRKQACRRPSLCRSLRAGEDAQSCASHRGDGTVARSPMRKLQLLGVAALTGLSTLAAQGPARPQSNDVAPAINDAILARNADGPSPVAVGAEPTPSPRGGQSVAGNPDFQALGDARSATVLLVAPAAAAEGRGRTAAAASDRRTCRSGGATVRAGWHDHRRGQSDRDFL